MRAPKKNIHSDKSTVQLEAERAKAEALFSSIGDGAVAIDEDGNISHINQAALDMLGYTADEMLGKWFPRTFVATDEAGQPIPTIRRPITKVFLTGKPVSAHIFYRRKDGSLLPANITTSPILLNHRPVGAIEIFKDMTKEFEIDKMKSEFISVASHQLRTPLTSIMTNSHMLAEGYLGELTKEQQLYMNNIIFSVDRMHELISTLLNITRIEAGKVAVRVKPTDLRKLVSDINTELQPKLSQKEITLTTDIGLDQPVKTDPLLVREVVANLLSNAVKYTPPKGKIHVRLFGEKKEVVYMVKDSGYGIPRDEQSRIFTKFFRASNVQRKESVGTGLGLYMIKGIADNLGGRLWFESGENKGTTFYFSIPTKGLTNKEGTTMLEPTSIL